MKLETFFEKFDQFADAPDAVPRMRRFILDLAVHGKLVAQDANDESAEELLTRIKAEKAQLVKSGEIKKQEQLPPVGDDAIRFSLPAGWAASQLGDVAVCLDNMREPINGTERDLRIAGKMQAELFPYYGATQQQGWIDDFIFDAELVLLGEDGVPFFDPLRSKAYLIAGKTWVNNHAHVFRGILVSNSYLMHWLNVFDYAGRVAGSTRSKLNQAKALDIPIALPPLAEQKRIVAKVDELMALCDRLEVQQQEREKQASKLARASLARFADAPTPANLHFLFHESYAISPADLRKSILTLAVQGKLVPQDPNDEPAEELLARLEQERTRIAKEQGVRTPKNVPPLTADSYPHDVPESWQWSRLGQLALVIAYGTSQKADSDSSKVPVYRMGNIVGGRLVDENLKYVDASIDDLPGLYLKTNDILFNRTNSYELVGKAGIYIGPDDKATFASYLIRIRLPDSLLFPPFYSVAMNAPYYRQTQIEPEVVQQCGQANFNGTKLASTVVPLPPLAEQRRIVAKVDELMALVDALETQMTTSRSVAEKLLTSMVAELTDGEASRATVEA